MYHMAVIEVTAKERVHAISQQFVVDGPSEQNHESVDLILISKPLFGALKMD
jgi:hypothetical protein